ncbi:MAG TPA: sulfotransferase, partial [Erythrobacter sp.]|nr:sulfotransferase [Erythrobacter sp.]
MSPPRSRFVFVAGLHRTGTSLLARIIAAHPAVSAIENAPVPENEGCYLQGAIPHTALDGRPGHYATDPLQHHTEQSPWNTLETQRRLLSDWGGWFDPDKPWWLEKSPINLTRMRLYQQLFPTAQFIVILRHPQLMAAALGKWVTDEPAALLRYGIDAYDTVAQDL